MLDVAAPRINGNGRFAGFVGSAVDVTDQKLAQEAMQKISGQLIQPRRRSVPHRAGASKTTSASAWRSRASSLHSWRRTFYVGS